MNFHKIVQEASLKVRKELLSKEAKMERKEEHDETLDRAFEESITEKMEGSLVILERQYNAILL